MSAFSPSFTGGGGRFSVLSAFGGGELDLGGGGGGGGMCEGGKGVRKRDELSALRC